MSASATTNSLRPTIGIGACLAGNAVRYNGTTKSANQYVTELAKHFELRPFCPEVAIGLGVPRPPIHLVATDAGVRALDVASHQHDYTAQLAGHAADVLELAPELCAYILVKGSPSCGYDRVKRFDPNGQRMASDQQGIFAQALARADPLLPLEDDGRLNDPGLRDSFITRAYAYHEWKKLREQGLSPRQLLAFYSRYKYQVMAHHIPSYKAIGPLLADAGKHPDISALGDALIELVMTALRHRATRRSHTNVLMHISGYLKKQITPPERQRLRELIDQYRLGLVPLIVPITMLQHHFANNPNHYVQQQVFMTPYPDDLKLRNAL